MKLSMSFTVDNPQVLNIEEMLQQFRKYVKDEKINEFINRKTWGTEGDWNGPLDNWWGLGSVFLDELGVKITITIETSKKVLMELS